jgi:hypothetical protein
LSQKLNKNELVIPAIVLAYYTLFQCYRLTDQWDSGQEYIEQFKQTCIILETNFREDYDESIVKLLLAEPRLIKQSPPMLIVRHGYDCYKMRSWLIHEITILNELKKWISRLPVAVIPTGQQEEN